MTTRKPANLTPAHPPRSEAIICTSCDANLTTHATHIAEWDGTRNRYYCVKCHGNGAAA